MATPIGHSLVGVTIYLLYKKKDTSTMWFSLLYCIIVSNLPDIDFICLTNTGIKFSGIYHHQVTHSITFIFILSLVAYVFMGVKWGIITGVCLFLHNLLDYFTFDNLPPVGIMFLYPFSKEYFISPISFWFGNEHRTLGDTISILSLISMGYDLITLGLFLLIGLVVRRWRKLKMEVNNYVKNA